MCTQITGALHFIFAVLSYIGSGLIGIWSGPFGGILDSGGVAKSCHEEDLRELAFSGERSGGLQDCHEEAHLLPVSHGTGKKPQGKYSGLV